MPTITKLGTNDLWDQFREKPLEFYRNVAAEMERAGVEDTPTIGRVLEFVSPSDKGEMPAFSRMLKKAGIRTRSNPRMGLWASEGTKFFDTAVGRALFVEFFARKWREISFADSEERATFLSDDGQPGSWQRPYQDASTARWDQKIAAAIPLSELVAMTTPINGQDYRSFYLTYNAANLRQFRLGESTEIPIATLADSERTIQLKKYGRGLRASYEQLRRARVDKLAFWIQYAAVQSEIDKVATAIYTLINGDGNSGTAPTTWDLNGDFSGTLQTLDANSWLWFKKKFVQPYVMTTVLMTEAVSLQLEQLDIGTANVLLNRQMQVPGAGTLTPINTTADGVRYGWTSEVGTWQMLALDRRFALERVTEIGGTISEMERFITNQTQVMTMTEVEGYAIMDANATLILDLND